MYLVCQGFLIYIDVTFKYRSARSSATIRWTVPFCRPAPIYSTTIRRPWRQLDTSAFRVALQSSSLCSPAAWASGGIDELAILYEVEVTAVLDQLIPACSTTCRRRPSDPWFDQDCRSAKRRVRQLERASRRANYTD